MKGITYIRIINGLSMNDLAKKIGVSKQTIDKWEKEIMPISVQRLEELSSMFNLDKRLFNKKISNEDKIIILENEIKNLKTI